MAAERKSDFWGVFLILLGLLLLSRKFMPYEMRQELGFLPLLLLVLGVSFLATARRGAEAGPVFPGTVLLLLGVLILFRRGGVPLSVHFMYLITDLWPATLCIVGIAFLALFAFRPSDWGLLVPGFLLLGLGLWYYIPALIWIPYVHVMLPRVSRYWPLGLILIGTVIVFNEIRRKQGT